MALIDKYSKLSDVILEDPSVITILNRFNIFLGVGDTAELHSPRFTFDEQVLEQGLALYEKLLDLK